MTDRQAFIDALERDEFDSVTRLVYADWLDDRGEVEEADRQRAWPAARAWLLDFARRHHAYGRYIDWDVADATGKDKYDRDTKPLAEEYYREFLEFLDAHAAGGGFFSFDIPDPFEYTEELWRSYEIVTGRKTPEGEYRHTMPPFRCSC